MTLSDRDIKKWLMTAKEATLLAGEFLSKYKRTLVEVKLESKRDIKITADTDSEEIIIDFLKKKSLFSILSEEAGLLTRKDKDIRWIVDPLDGSFNYMRMIPISCVSVGLWHNEKPILGVVYDFNKKELFSGIAGRGAWLNQTQLKVSDVDSKEKAVLCTGFPVRTDFSSKAVKELVNNIRAYKKVRLIGSAALSIAYVAAGRVDAYKEDDIMIWDVAGGIPILLGAGGRLDMKRARTLHSRHVFLWNGRLKR